MFPNLNTYDNIGPMQGRVDGTRVQIWMEKHIPNNQPNEFKVCPMDDMHVNTPSI
jgi:hypothetical protein